MTVYTRWVLCYKHDGQPFGELHIHKASAEKELLKHKNPNKFLIKEFAMASK
jgi:hypothetical protein